MSERCKFLHFFFFVLNRLQIDHRQIAAAFKVARLVEHIGDPAGHARGEVDAGLAKHYYASTGHVLTTVVPGPFDNRDGARIPDRKAFPGDARK